MTGIRGVWLRFFDDRAELLVDAEDGTTRLAMTVAARDARGAHFVSAVRAARGQVVDVDQPARGDGQRNVTGTKAADGDELSASPGLTFSIMEER